MVKPVSFLTQIFRYGNSDGPILRAKLKISSKVKILKNAFKKNMGINDKKQLSQAERSYQMRQAEDLMSSGLTMATP